MDHAERRAEAAVRSGEPLLHRDEHPGKQDDDDAYTCHPRESDYHTHIRSRSDLPC